MNRFDIAFPVKYRLCVGAAFFLILALVDLSRHGRNATRWREYLFLLTCVAAAMMYGMINDQITSRISWEYFYYGKELFRTLGPRTPPDPGALHFQAAGIGVMATWWVGLLMGAVLLFINSLRKPRRPMLNYRQLFKIVAAIFLICVNFALLLGWAGWRGKLNWISPDFRELTANNFWRPRRFMAVYGIHLGGYVGGVIGIIWGSVTVWKAK